VQLHAASSADLPFLSALARDPLVESYLMPGAGELDRLEALLERAESEGGPSGLFVIQSDDGGPLGGLALQAFSRRSRLCELTTLMVSPQVRRTGVGTAAVRLACRHVLVEHGFHRLQAETYGDNVAGRRLFERAGFVREGVRRQAYWRRDRWLDGVIYGLLAEEFDAGDPGSPVAPSG
jgi:RimJ/RimL family protein N-acetyltransferase